MVLLTVAPSEQPSTTGSSAVLISKDDAGSSASGGAIVRLSYSDYLIERPIEFVEGLEAHPSRGPQVEPSGSGPFGF